MFPKAKKRFGNSRHRFLKYVIRFDAFILMHSSDDPVLLSIKRLNILNRVKNSVWWKIGASKEMRYVGRCCVSWMC